MKTINALIMLMLTMSAMAEVRINEFMAENRSCHVETDYYNFADWVELYNSGDSEVSLTNYRFSNDPTLTTTWTLPSSAVIPANGYLVLWLDEKSSGLHGPFTLKKGSGTLTLLNPSLSIVDQVTYDKQYPDYSFGRGTTGDWLYLSEATVGSANSLEGFADATFAESVTFSTPAGFYNSTQSVTLSSGTNEIRYTLDGSVPSKGSLLYSSPISVTESTVIMARAYDSAALPSIPEVASYMINQNAKLPIISLSIKPDYMFGDTLGFYVQGTNGAGGYVSSSGLCNYKQPWKRPVGIEFFEVSGERVFSTLGETKIFGGWSREAVIKSMALFFGDTIDYQLFSTKKLDKFDSVVVRNGGAYWARSKIKDAAIQRCVEGYLDVDHQHTRPVMIYVNGDFWAVMNMRDKLNDDFVSHTHGVDADAVDVLETPNDAATGDLVAYKDLLQYTADNDVWLPEHFDYVSSLVDLEEMANFWIVETCVGNTDWANNNGNRYNNIKWWHARDNSFRWRWMLYDLDHGLSSATTNKHSDGMLTTFPFFGEALNNADFKKWYIQRATAVSNIIFDGDRVETIANILRDEVAVEMPRHIEKWRTSGNVDSNADDLPWWKDPDHPQCVQLFNGHNYKSDGYMGIPTFENWYESCAPIVTVAKSRQVNYRQQLQTYFELGELNSLNIKSSGVEMGKVHVNGVKSELADFSGDYFNDYTVELEAVPEKNYTFVEWQVATSTRLTTVVVPNLSTWKYFDDNWEPAADWESVSYSDASWQSGPAKLGYSDSAVTVISYGDDSANKNRTAYFRKTFTVDSMAGVDAVELNLLRDDGAVVYLNGQEVCRSNMPTGVITHDTFASGSVGGATESTYFNYSVPVNYLVEGENLLAVEVHQRTSTSSDLGFDLNLSISQTTADTGIEVVKTPTLSLELLADKVCLALFRQIPQVIMTEINYLGNNEFIEVYNHADYAIDISGWSCDGVELLFPDNTILAPKEIILLVADRSQWAGVPYKVFEWSSGDLADDGETLQLIDIHENVVNTVSYEAVGAWPVLEDGATLEMAHYGLGNEQASSWRHSWYRGGSPGTKNSLNHPVILSEIFYNAPAILGSDDDYEFIELYHRGDYSIDLSGYEFVKGISFTFSQGVSLQPSDYLVIASNADSYANQDFDVLQWSAGSLSNGGEAIRLEDVDGYKVFDVTYGTNPPWPILADGGGSSIVLRDIFSDDLDCVDNWTDSGVGNTTPGSINKFTIQPALIVNEVLTHTDWPQVDFIEIYNPTNAPVDLSGWWLTDSLDTPQNYELPSGTVIGAGQYFVVYEDNDGIKENNLELPAEYFGSKFSLSSHGEEVYLFSPDLEYSNGFEFPASENGYSFGRYTNSAGEELLPVMSSLSSALQNSDPHVNSVVFSEIMYNPSEAEFEFVEIVNSSDSDVELYDVDNPENCWKVNGLNFTFPTGVSLNAGETVTLIPITVTIADFKTAHNLDGSCQIFQYSGSLDNGGERLTLLKPDKPDELMVPYLIVDSVRYNDVDPWPELADGEGYSLVRKYPLTFADDPMSWQLGQLSGSPSNANVVSLTVNSGSGSGEYFYGSLVEIKPDGLDRATFSHWTDGTTDAFSAQSSVKVVDDVEVSAMFKADIVWPTPSDLTYGMSVGADQLNATCHILGEFHYMGPRSMLLPGEYVLEGSFIPEDTSTYVTNSLSVNLTVNKAELYLAADDKQVREGHSLPSLSFSATGLVNQESLDDAFSGAPDLGLSVTDSDVLGTFPITITTGSLASDNYNFNFVDGSLFVFEQDRLYEVDIELNMGWNLISVPFEKICAVDYFNQDEIISDLYAWSSGYLPLEYDDIIPTEEGVWLFSFTEQQATISGFQPRKKEFISTDDWQLRGVLMPCSAKSTSEYTVWSWNSEEHFYEVVDELLPGKGYWLVD